MSLKVRDETESNVGAGSDPLGESFYPLYTLLFDENSGFVTDVKRKLAQSRMTDTVEIYLSRALGIGVISGLLLWILGVLLGYGIFVALDLVSVETLVGMPVQNEALIAFFDLVRIPALVFGVGLVLGTIGFLLGFGVLVAVPYSRASARKREINMLLTDSVSFMYALAVGGLNQLEILEAMADAEDTYGEVSKEFQNIVQETEYFDIDYRTAIRKQALETPSDELAQFLTDMLSIINSGGDMESFLEDKKEKHMRTAKQEQETTLDTLELFGEMYMTLSLFPLLLIILMVIMQIMPDVDVSSMMLYLVVYALIPLTGIGFIVMVSTVKHDEPGDGFLSRNGDDRYAQRAADRGLLDLGLVEAFTGEYTVFDRIKKKEGTHETIAVLRRPHVFFRDNPTYTLGLTVPTALVVVVVAMADGSAPTSWSGFIERPVWSTVIYFYVPLYLITVPLAVFREWNVRSRTSITNTLSEDLRKLSSANDTGQTLLESLKSTADTSSGKLATEFEEMHTKVNYGMSLGEAMVEFNNKYHIPRLARTVKLITKAQEASNEISDVLRTAAAASENHDDIVRDRKTRTMMQVVIIVMSFLTMLAVIAILQTQFIDTMAGMQPENGGGGDEAGLELEIDTNELSLLFFHAVTLQAVLAGFISGYIRDADLLSGLKYAIVLATIALVTWSMVG
ncbi:type II secretion system F family protein [Natrialbaceae archaeon AArc-T1-2]|uniref:type II secretion system F family protein n=1 Tax=Natrialbaceae archaeon AArc-T1-2 TaxID=3053904 RepID=UPI00255B391A|nr:type II secretion system F family protein [Natrialbaceae archaeon AArc-T1-2]WIV67777.1 type II secretion system F family protein [Natrialbaceae archaeon AArc-T1-2]